MKVFTDNKNRKWDCSFNSGTNRRVLAGLSVNLVHMFQDHPKHYAALIADDVKFTDVLYWVLKPQVERIGLSEDEFHEGFDEGIIMDAAASLYEGVVDFFKDPKKRELLRALWKKAEDVASLVQAGVLPKALQEVEAMSPEKAAAEILEQMEKRSQELKSKNLSSNAPEFAESIPTREPTTN